ncbi:hypothetical protein BGZ76_007249 [Entomortierella beljakovae]|nr:hypothetical protein BGZ76_007249 [Entomortierella beljakovae]
MLVPNESNRWSHFFPVPGLHLGAVFQTPARLHVPFNLLLGFLLYFCIRCHLHQGTHGRSRYSGHKKSLSSRMSKDEAPGVSIIRPLRGIDCNMYENLASSFRQDYPRFEIIFSVAQANDPAIAVVNELIKKYPKVDARIIIGEKNVGINPKINNMIQSYETAKYDIVWVCDSNVYVDSGCMGRSVDKMMKPKVGLVHHLPFGVRPQTLGAELELMFLDSVHAKMYLFINWTGLASCVVGKSNLYRRSDLDKVGGLAAFGKFMAEDNLVATAIFNMGYKHEMTSDLAYQSLGSMSPSDYFIRRARWTRIRKYTVTAATVVEPFIEMIGCGLVASYGFNLLWNIHMLNFLAFHVVIWFLADWSLYQALSGEKMDNLRGFLMAWCLRELAALPLFTYAVVGSTVDWRDQTFLLLRDGTVKAIPPTTSTKPTKFAAFTSSSTFSTPAPSTSSSADAIPLSPTTASSWANNMVTQSTKDSLKKFLRHPAVISIVSSTLAVIHFVVDILIKSQRNGNEEDELLEEQLSDSDDAMTSVSEKDENLKKSALNHRIAGRSKSKKYGLDYDGDDSSAAENDVVLRRSVRLRTSNQSKFKQFNSLEMEGDDERVIKYSNIRNGTETEHGRRSVEEDELSKAVEPYLSDSLSRRGRNRRHDIPAASQFLNVSS